MGRGERGERREERGERFERREERGESNKFIKGIAFKRCMTQELF